MDRPSASRDWRSRSKAEGAAGRGLRRGPGQHLRPAGVNGAGKTTIVRILSTLLSYDAGTATVERFDGATQPANVRQSISSAFVPTDSMPGPVRAFAEHQPDTPIVNTIRALLTGQPAGATLDEVLV